MAQTSTANVYGLVWDYGQGSALARLTPEADPLGRVTAQIEGQPTAAVGTTGGASPCDSLSPWKDMVRYNVDSAGKVTPFTAYDQDTVVWIPPFYSAIYQDAEGQKLYIYLSAEQADGLTLHPGGGRYVARYATGEGFVTHTGVAPLWGENRDHFRQGAISKGEGWRLYGMPTHSAIGLLYLMEWANWDSQSAIGQGVTGAVDDAIVSGGTDAMTYHTGRAEGTDGETAVQYRWLENLWGNVSQWVDGFNAQNGRAYLCADETLWADDTSEGYTDSGVDLPSGWIGAFAPDAGGWALLPSQAADSAGAVPDYVGQGFGQEGWRTVAVGGFLGDEGKAGLFSMMPDYTSDYGEFYVGGRMQFTPASEVETVGGGNMQARIRMKRDTQANWEAANPVIQKGEWIVVDTTDGQVRCKVGDGTTAYADLAFVDAPIYAALESKVNTTGGTISGGVTISDTTEATNEESGALVVKGGVGVAGDVYANRVFGAVWNDYAERRIVEDEIVSPGQVVCETGRDTLALSTERMQPMGYVISDTYGMEIGKREQGAQPVAVAGRVLVKVQGDRGDYQVGDALCAAPGGVACKMTAEEAAANPQCVQGYMCGVPDYESWGNDEHAIQVNGRVWMRIQ